jgi:hypothetical protein
MQRLIASLHAGERLDRPLVQPQQQTAINNLPTTDTLSNGSVLMVLMITESSHRFTHAAVILVRRTRTGMISFSCDSVW